jgi:hypothetical protein
MSNDPARAADYAAWDADIFNSGNGVYAAQFVAALASQLMTDPDISQAIAIARRQVPADAVLARLIDDMIRWPETFAVLMGLLYGEGDFRKSVSLATMCGFDTDCNAGTVGCLLGLRNGLENVPAEWKDPLGDIYELQVTGLPRQWKIRELAREMAETGVALARREGPPAERAASTVAAPAASTPAKPCTGKFTLMALGDNNLSDLEPLVGHYDLLIASHSVGTDVLSAFRQRNPGAAVFCYFNRKHYSASLPTSWRWRETGPTSSTRPATS